MRSGAVIQARLGSTRLPGKVLRPIHGVTLLGRVVARVALARTLDAVAVATTVAPEDDAIAAWCLAEGVPCLRGPVDDVLHRYVLAVRALRLDLVVRVTGDCPFICPDLLDRCVEALRTSGADIALGDAPSIHEGFDPCRADLLEAADRESLLPEEREHLALLLRRRFDRLRAAEVPIPPAEAPRPGLRLSVDEPADLAFAEAALAELDRLPAPFRTADLLALLDRRPALIDLNRRVARTVRPGVRP